MAAKIGPEASAGTIQSGSSNTSRLTTTSSMTGASTREGRKEEDFTKDNVASPIDLECSIQTERITKILDETIYKCKLAICLPELVTEYRMLSSIVSPEDMDDLVIIFDQYDNPLVSSSILNVEILEELKVGNLSLKTRLNPDLSQLMYILYCYPELKPKVEEIIAKKREQISDVDNTPPKDQPALEFLKDLENFRDQMLIQIETTAAEELATKLHTRKLEESNESLLTIIKELSDTQKEETEKFEQTMILKNEVIVIRERELALLQQESTAKLKKKILDSERQMVLASRAHAIKKEMLKEEEIETREGYQTLLSHHMIEEKNQRARRFKVETQLLSWLQKYDGEMADKQVELDEFIQKYEEEMEICEKLEKEIEEQDKEYIPLMAEREAEYHEEMTQKMQKFMVEHAARIIQHAWREVLLNRAEKKKLKKIQKKRQAEAAAQAKREEAEAKKLERLAKKAAREAKAEAKRQKAEEKAAAKRAKEEAKAQGKGGGKAKKEDEDEDD